MTAQETYIGAVGPFKSDSSDVYPDNGQAMAAGRFDGPVKCSVDPTAGDHLVRKSFLEQYLNLAVDDPLEVADIKDPVELGTVSGAVEGDGRIIYQGSRQAFYRWTAEIVEDGVPGLTGTWLALAGEDVFGDSEISGSLVVGVSVTAADATITDDLTVQGDTALQGVSCASLAASGDISSVGAVSIGGNNDVAGNQTVEGTTLLKGAVTVGKTGAAGKTYFHNGAAVVQVLEAALDGTHLIGSYVWIGPTSSPATSMVAGFTAIDSVIDFATGNGVENGFRFNRDITLLNANLTIDRYIRSFGGTVFLMAEGANTTLYGNLTMDANGVVYGKYFKAPAASSIALQNANALGLTIDTDGIGIFSRKIRLGNTYGIETDNGLAVLTIGGQDVTLAHNLTVANGVISGTGAPCLYLNGANLETYGTLKVTGNQINGSGTAGAITLNNKDVTIGGVLTLTGNSVKSSTGAQVCALDGADLRIKGALILDGGTVKDLNGLTVFSIVNTDLSLGHDLILSATGLISSSTSASSIALVDDAITLAGGLVTVDGPLTVDGEANFGTINCDILNLSGAAVMDKLQLSSNVIENSLGNTIINYDAAENSVHVQLPLVLHGAIYHLTETTAAITLSGADVLFGGDIQVGGNDIKASTGAVALTLSGPDVAIAGDLTLGGNDIKSATATAMTLSGADVLFAGDIKVGGGDIKSPTGSTGITLANSQVTIPMDLLVGPEMAGSIKTNYIQAYSDMANGIPGDLTIEDESGAPVIIIPSHAYGGGFLTIARNIIFEGTLCDADQVESLSVAGGNVYVSEALQVNGNVIKNSASQDTVAFSGINVISYGNIQVNGNHIAGDGGAAALTLDGANVTIEGNQTVDGEINGSVDWLVFSQSASAEITFPTALLLKYGETQTNYNKAPVKISGGSLSGYSIDYDLTACTADHLYLAFYAENLEIHRVEINKTVADNKKAYGKFDRGDFPYVAGDRIMVGLLGSNGSFTVDTVIVRLRTIDND
jgi:hypothetical protein